MTIRIPSLIILLVLTISSSGCNQPDSAPALKGGRIADRSFIRSYDAARIRAISTTPTAIISVNDALFLYRNGTMSSQVPVSSKLYTALKEVSHVVLGVWLAVWDSTADDARSRSQAYLPRIAAIESALSDSVIPTDLRQAQSHLLNSSSRLISMTEEAGGVSEQQLHEWAATVKPDLLVNVQNATRAKLDTINSSMKKLAGDLTSQEKSELIVVICGVHQARQGNLQMQYFTALLGPEAAAHDRRLLFAESINQLDDALNMLGTHQLDRAISESFFGTPYRMQRDLLDDAATEIIPELDLPEGF